MKKKILVSAGDAITAKLVEQAGFDGIWVSGFEASARLGLADNGSITMTEMLRVVEPIVRAVNIPVYVDCDTGYGNFQRTVTEFEHIGVDGVCIEDVEPGFKQNSLWGGQVPLIVKDAFADIINVRRKNIKIIARTEAIIRGYGEKEALDRLVWYSMYGNADILLPHTRTDDELYYPGLSRYKWAIVPTKFPHYHNKELFDMGYHYVIWANQTERVKIKAIRKALNNLIKNDNAFGIEQNLSASLDDMKGLTPDE